MPENPDSTENNPDTIIEQVKQSGAASPIDVARDIFAEELSSYNSPEDVETILRYLPNEDFTSLDAMIQAFSTHTFDPEVHPLSAKSYLPTQKDVLTLLMALQRLGDDTGGISMSKWKVFTHSIFTKIDSRLSRMLHEAIIKQCSMSVPDVYRLNAEYDEALQAQDWSVALSISDVIEIIGDAVEEWFKDVDGN